MQHTTTDARSAAGWTVVDAARHSGQRRPRPTVEATTLTLDASDLAAAARSLADAAPTGASALIRRTAGGLELTVSGSRRTWETAVIPVDPDAPGLTAGVDVSTLADVAAHVAAERATVTVRATPRGGLVVDGVEVPAADGAPAAPPRPSVRGMVEHRIELPASLPEGVPIRIPGVAVTVPRDLRGRLARRGVTLVNLFETDDGWFVSGIAQGRPMYALVGEVAVY